MKILCKKTKIIRKKNGNNNKQSKILSLSVDNMYKVTYITCTWLATF